MGLDGFNAIMDYIPRIHLVLRQGILCCIPAYVDQVDVPRLRIDQILSLEWKYLVPISLVNLIIMVLIVVFGLHF